MALETDRKEGPKKQLAAVLERSRVGLATGAKAVQAVGDSVSKRYARFSAAVSPCIAPIVQPLSNTWLMRFVSRTLLRRIIVSNLLGLTILMAGLMYLSQFNSWLIDAKIVHLREQSHIMSAAIASKASLNNKTVGDPLQDNPFAALEFSIEPEIVVPLIRTLLDKSENRGRIYDISGVLLADSSQILRSGNIIPIRPARRISTRKPTTKNNWTRLTQWLMNSDLRVYKDIGRANGRYYPEVRAALTGETTALMMLARKRQRIVSVATPIMRGNEVRGALLLSTAPGTIDDVQADELFAVLVLVLVAAAAALLASILLARTVAEPVKQLSQYANEVTHDIQAAKDLPRFDERADEVGQLARSFSLMTRALYRRIEASEKFAADVAHELKNPLTAARSTAESLAYVKTDQQRDDFIEQIQLELKRLNKLISDVSEASRLDADLALQRFEPVHLRELVEQLAETFQSLSAADNRHIEVDIDPVRSEGAYLVSGQQGRIGQVLTNLLSNALSFTPEGGTVTVRLKRHPNSIDMIVQDEGPGIDVENLEQVFARFYTYRPTANSSRGDNSGLGLSISREIVEAHNGRIWAENHWPGNAEKKETDKRGDTSNDPVKPHGARFIVRLPAANAAARSARRGRLSGGR